jgi:mevalonate kinase
MPAITASAPGKIILFGEHAVVYGRPAIAMPIFALQAKAIIQPLIHAEPGSIIIDAPDINLRAEIKDLPTDHPLVVAIRAGLDKLHATRVPSLKIKITSTIPPASGLGSGAAVTVSLLRALSSFLGQPLDNDQINHIAYEVEKIYHGTPSGIDNTVVTYAVPVFFMKGKPIEYLQLPIAMSFVIADTGVSSPTVQTVSNVRSGWEAYPKQFESIFDSIGSISRRARDVIETGEIELLGALMDENHLCLQKLGVSSPELDRLVEAAKASGALGAKLSGGGGGGNMIALVTPDTGQRISEALHSAGAIRTVITQVQ